MQDSIVNYLYSNKLDTKEFGQILNNTTQSYKYYWLEAIMKLLNKSDLEISFDDIVNQMICDSWFTVSRYHLRLGPNNKSDSLLEQIVNKLVLLEGDKVSPNIDCDEIVEIIKRHDGAIREEKKALIVNVPYRLLDPFMRDGNRPDWAQQKRLIAYMEQLNESKPLLYTIIDGPTISKKIRLNPSWKEFLLDNSAVILGWIQMEKVRYLQNRNPGVPGIIYKLSAENESARKLEKARALWKCVGEVATEPLRDIYSGEELYITKTDIDHFVPWSYIANDELWNLIPMNASLNRSKSNSLPDWDLFFRPMANLQYRMYATVCEKPGLEKLFDDCKINNLNSIWANEKLYVRSNTKEVFVGVLEENLKPIYESAKLQGYRMWNYGRA